MTDVAVDQTTDSSVEAELRKFNWGGFLWGWVWALGHRAWLWGIVGLIPIVSLVVQFILGFRGNRIAWENGNYSSAEELRQKERKWAWAALWFFLAILVLSFVIALAGGSE